MINFQTGTQNPLSLTKKKVLLAAIEKCMKQYGDVVEVLAPFVNSIQPMFRRDGQENCTSACSATAAK